MPPKIRAILTVLVIVLAIVLWQLRDAIQLGASSILYFGVVLLICGSIWLFPEVKKND